MNKIKNDVDIKLKDFEKRLSACERADNNSDMMTTIKKVVQEKAHSL